MYTLSKHAKETVKTYVQKIGLLAPRRLHEIEERGAEFRRNLNEHRSSKLSARFDAESTSRLFFVIIR